MTDTTERVLRVLLEDPTARWYGYELMKATGVHSGTLYPMLARLAEQGLVVSEWETGEERPGGRPPRKFYRLTGIGVSAARVEVAEYAAARHTLAPARPGRTAALRPSHGGTR